MATVKIVLRRKRNQDGSYPLAVRITKDRKSTFIHLGKQIQEKDWDEVTQIVRKSHPNSQRLNNFLRKKLAEASDKVLELETHQEDVSSRVIKEQIKPSSGSSFFAQAQLYLENLRQAGKYNRYTADKPRIKHFKEFLGGRDISFKDITVSQLQQFKTYLKNTAKVGERTAVNHLIVIRSVFSQAIIEGILDKKYYPFGKDKIRIKFPDSLKIGLSREEVQRLEEVELPIGSNLNHARNLWLISFYFAGMRASDVLRLRWSDFQNHRLHYVMGKNAKGDSLKIPEKALKILSQYESKKKNKNDLVFPELRNEDFGNAFLVQKKIAHTVSRIDKCLRNKVAPLVGIDKPLTIHIARHTFGNLSGDKIPIQMLQKLYRHSSILTTIGYQANFVHKDADEALDAVLDFGKNI